MVRGSDRRWVERLPVRAQRALQCLSAFGGRATRAELAEVADPRDLEAIDELVNKGLVVAEGDRLDVSHPFLAELRGQRGQRGQASMITTAMLFGGASGRSPCATPRPT